MGLEMCWYNEYLQSLFPAEVAEVTQTPMDIMYLVHDTAVTFHVLQGALPELDTFCRSHTAVRVVQPDCPRQRYDKQGTACESQLGAKAVAGQSFLNERADDTSLANVLKDGGLPMRGW